MHSQIRTEDRYAAPLGVWSGPQPSRLAGPPPDFAVVGAPKCATTSLYTLLRKHPQVFLPSVKEPHYFALDYPGRRELATLDDYDALFRHAADRHRGEVSTTYLLSSCAVDNILARRPDARIVAVIRNPVDLFVSWHNECLNALDEDEPDPERAWRLQESRARGERIPRLCKEPAFLQYRKVCMLGAQIAALSGKVPSRQLLILRFEDIRSNPETAFGSLAAFLDIAPFHIGVPVHENGFASHRSPAAARLVSLGYANPAMRKLKSKLRPAFHALGIRPTRWLLRFSLRPSEKPALSDAFRQELASAFEADQRLADSTVRRLTTRAESASPEYLY